MRSIVGIDSRIFNRENQKGNVVRYKLQKNSVRFERQVKFDDKNEWSKIWSEYYENLEINPETGKLRIVKK